MAQRKQGTPTEIKPYDDLLEERVVPFQGSVQVDYIFRHMVLKYSVKKATQELGISVSYGNKMNLMWARDPKFRGRVMKKLDSYPDDYKAGCRSLLPDILKAEVAGLKAIRDNPELGVKHPQLLKQMKMGAGIDLSDNPPPVVTNVNIQAMQLLIRDSIRLDDESDDSIIDIQIQDNDKNERIIK